VTSGMSKRELREAAAVLRCLASVVAQGGVTAPAGFVGRLEGAAEALDVLGRRPPRKSHGEGEE